MKTKKRHEAADRAKKAPISHWLRLSHLPSLVRMGAKMVKARIVAVGSRMLSLAVPLRIMLRT